MSARLKCVIALVVALGTFYVLVSPLPEMDATFSGKSALTFFLLVTHVLLSFFILVRYMLSRVPVAAVFVCDDLLELNCIRLC